MYVKRIRNEILPKDIVESEPLGKTQRGHREERSKLKKKIKERLKYL